MCVEVKSLSRGWELLVSNRFLSHIAIYVLSRNLNITKHESFEAFVCPLLASVFVLSVREGICLL